jgi:putative flavoprotein involved in K+ transport
MTLEARRITREPDRKKEAVSEHRATRTQQAVVDRPAARSLHMNGNGEPEARQDRERFDVVVIGGGQAGLAMGYHLAKRGVEFVILDASERVGDAWRKRWDTLRVFTPARYSGLPGMRFPAPGHSYPTKDEVADYLEDYARQMKLPVRSGITVDRVSRMDDVYVISAGDRQYEARQVVIAAGAYRHPKIPAFAAELDPGIRQLHASEYRNPSQLQDGAVLIVGASNSGAEIANDVGRQSPTLLSGRDTGKLPFHIDGRAARVLTHIVWFAFNRILTVSTPMGRKALPSMRDHGGPLERVKPDDLAAAGVERVYARTTGAPDGKPVLDGGRVLDVTNVIWCTGFRQDFSWIDLPITGEDGWPLQKRGVVPAAPGLYFVGLPFMHSFASPLIGGVGRDAAHVARHIARRAATVGRQVGAPR